MLKANYHAHSLFCNHASETLESNVKLAIKNGFVDFGISEHSPIENVPGDYRLDEDKMKLYFEEMNRLKKKYQGQINLFTGYEADVINPLTGENNTQWIIEHLDKHDLNYLLLANHTYGNKGHVFTTIPNLQMAQEWIGNIKKAWLTKKFLYLVHPDGFSNAYLNEGKPWDDVAFYLADEITKFAADQNMPLGINVNGIKDKKGYPDLVFWKIASKNGAKAIIELDTHDPDTFKLEYIQKAFDIAKKTKIEIIEKLEI